MRRLLLLICLPVLFAGYREALPGYLYHFPQDHFDHPAFRTEWWYYTGNLKDPAGKRFGFELVFFRQAQHRGAAANPSSWRIDDLYLAHAAVTAIDASNFQYSERLNRAGPGLAGTSLPQQRVWNGNWSAQWNGARQTLTATSDKFSFTLTLTPQTAPVIHGIGGVSQKGDAPGQASHYVSFPLLTAIGKLRVNDSANESDTPVSGQAWMDHEWFTEQLDTLETGWDWFSAQFDNHTELMLFDLRRKDGSIDSHSSGTYIDKAGNATHLTSADFQLHPIDYWSKYPIKWRIEIPRLHLSIECAAAIDNQELVAAGNSYWEGSVTYRGTHTGVGYLEMTGYRKPVAFH